MRSIVRTMITLPIKVFFRYGNRACDTAASSQAKIQKSQSKIMEEDLKLEEAMSIEELNNDFAYASGYILYKESYYKRMRVVITHGRPLDVGCVYFSAFGVFVVVFLF